MGGCLPSPIQGPGDGNHKELTMGSVGIKASGCPQTLRRSETHPFHHEVPTQKTTLRHPSAGLSVWIYCLRQCGTQARPLGHTFSLAPPQTWRCGLLRFHGRPSSARPWASLYGASLYRKPGHSLLPASTGRGSWGLRSYRGHRRAREPPPEWMGYLDHPRPALCGLLGPGWARPVVPSLISQWGKVNA